MDDLAERFQEAVQYFWTGRDSAQQRQFESGVVDAGTRGSVTSGGHMGAIEALVVDLLVEAGIERANNKFNSRTLELPGYFRAQKQWDLLVASGNQLIAAMEFKSQVGPSFGNNLNNRAEEAIGNAVDVWTAFREGTMGINRPFPGYFFLLEDCPEVHTPVNMYKRLFPVDPIFPGTTRSQRYAILCKRLILEGLYNATCLTLATKSTTTVVSHPVPELGFEKFAAQLQGHAMGFAGSSGISTWSAHHNPSPASVVKASEDTAKRPERRQSCADRAAPPGTAGS